MAKLGSKNAVATPGRFNCAQCSEDVSILKPGETNPGIWRKTAEVYHCDGKSSAFGAIYRGENHHYTSRYSPCWKCKADLGCRRCSGVVSEVLCMNGSGKKREGGFYGHDGMGPVWGTVEALCEHGLMVDQSIEQYPAYWADEYRRTA